MTFSRSNKATIHVLAGLLAGSSLIPLAGLANGFRNPPSGAAAMGQDGALTVWVDDASAVAHNPANLAGRKNDDVLVGMVALHTEADLSSPLLSASTRDPWKLLPHAFAAWSLNDQGLAAGIGVSSPYGQSTEWSKSVPFLYLSEMMMADVSPAIAGRLTDTLRVGVAANLYLSQLELRQSIPWAMLPGGSPADMPGSARLEGDAYALGASLGLTWDCTPAHRLALHYRSQFDMDYEGDTRLGGIPARFAGALAPTSDFDSTIKFPNTINVGFGWQVNADLRLGFDLEWIEHSRNQSIPLDMGVNSAAGLFPSSTPQNWDDTWNFGAATAWRMNDQVELRASYKFLATPIPDETFSPSLMDTDKHMLTVGMGWTKDAHRLDSAFTYGILEDRTITSSATPQNNGRYEMNSVILALSYAYAF